MRVKLSELRKAINQFLQEALEQHEDLDRLRRAKDGYGETDFEESVQQEDIQQEDIQQEDIQQEDHTAHSKESGYTNEVEEALTGASGGMDKPKSASSSAALHTRDKSKMQGVGPRPTMATAFGNEKPQQKKEAAPPPQDPRRQTSLGNPKKGVQMQGVGPRPTMSNAFDDLGKKKTEDKEQDPNKTVEIPRTPTDLDAVERQFSADMRAKKKAANQETIKQISQQQQGEMQKQGWKFTRHPSGNWQATPPPKEGMQEISPPGKTSHGKSYEKVTKAIKKSGSAENPWAVAWSMKNKGE